MVDRAPARFTRFTRQLCSLALAMAVSATVALAPAQAAAGRSTDASAETLRRVEDALETLKSRLGVDGEISPVLVDRHPLVVAVERTPGQRGAYRLSLEAAFLDELTDEELDAVVAHELGHVWIFSHHPYLQTEQLANKIAMRVVERRVLESVYAKVWARGRRRGDLPRFAP